MNKFFDYLMEDLPDCVICELLSYIRRFSSAVAGDVPVEGKMGNYRFCASRHGAEQVRVRVRDLLRERALPADTALRLTLEGEVVFLSITDRTPIQSS